MTNLIATKEAIYLADLILLDAGLRDYTDTCNALDALAIASIKANAEHQTIVEEFAIFLAAMNNEQGNALLEKIKEM
jgi:hypothetical protein